MAFASGFPIFFFGIAVAEGIGHGSPICATQEAHFISYRRLLPPRETAKLFLADGWVGRGGWDRICIPHF
jgi:hypothetical protein